MRPRLNRFTWCKHWTSECGLMKKDDCKVGLNPREVTGGLDLGWMIRKPCNKEYNSSIVCEKFEYYSIEEVNEIESEIQECIKRMSSAEPWINQKKKENPEGGSGVDKCPLCGEKIHWAISSYNGHMHVHCETEKCLAFSE